MMLAVILGALVTIPLLALVTFVQVLYLESLRLRTRDLPSLKFFKETLEDKIGLKTEQGAGRFLAGQALAAGLAGDPVLRLVRRRASVAPARSSGRRRRGRG